MAIQSLADFYESWLPTTSLRKTLEKAIDVKRFRESYRAQTKTSKSRQAYVDELLGTFKSKALSNKANELADYAVVRDYASDKNIKVPTYGEFYDRLARAYSKYLDTTAGQLDQELAQQTTALATAGTQLTEVTETATAEAKKAERAALVTKRLTSLAQERQNQQNAKQQAASVQTGVSRNVRQPKQIGQPGVQVTRVSKPAVGGYGGTSPGRVNPTGLNI